MSLKSQATWHGTLQRMWKDFLKMVFKEQPHKGVVNGTMTMPSRHYPKKIGIKWSYTNHTDAHTHTLTSVAEWDWSSGLLSPKTVLFLEHIAKHIYQAMIKFIINIMLMLQISRQSISQLASRTSASINQESYEDEASFISPIFVSRKTITTNNLVSSVSQSFIALNHPAYIKP